VGKELPDKWLSINNDESCGGMKDARQLLSAPCQVTVVCDIIISTASTSVCLVLLFLLAGKSLLLSLIVSCFNFKRQSNQTKIELSSTW
jgi:hypothetical protein